MADVTRAHGLRNIAGSHDFSRLGVVLKTIWGGFGIRSVRGHMVNLGSGQSGVIWSRSGTM